MLLADLEQRRHERRVVEAGHDDALVGLVERARVPGGVGGDDPPVEAERRQRPAEAAQQLDPPARGRDQDGHGAARFAVGRRHGAASARSMPEPGNSGRVAWPSWLMPSRLDHAAHRRHDDAHVERHRVVLHVPDVHVELIVPGQGVAAVGLRPPGDARSNLVPSGVGRRSSGAGSGWAAGGGPTRLISPRSTFTSVGSSSRLVARSTLPSLVSRASSVSGPSSPGSAVRMVRNLTSSNVAPCRPARCWRNITGEPIVSRMASATATSTGHVTSRTRRRHHDVERPRRDLGHRRSLVDPAASLAAHRCGVSRVGTQRATRLSVGGAVVGDTVDVAGTLESGREAWAHRRWGAAVAALGAADGAAPLAVDDLERLAIALFLTGAEGDSTEAWARAYHACIDEDDVARAARCAFWLGFALDITGTDAPRRRVVRARPAAGRRRRARLRRTGLRPGSRGAGHADGRRGRGGGPLRVRRHRRHRRAASTTPTWRRSAGSASAMRSCCWAGGRRGWRCWTRSWWR